MKLLRLFLIQLKNAANVKRSYCDVFFNKNVVFFINLFYEKGFISSYLLVTAKKIRIFLSYFKFHSFFFNLKIFFKKLKEKELQSLIKQQLSVTNCVFYLKTFKGIFTLEELKVLQKFKQTYLICCIKY